MMRAVSTWLPSLALAGLVCFLAAGCETDSSSEYDTVNQRQAQAVGDPMNYKMNMDDMDLTGGGTANYDPAAVKRDMDDVVNP